VDAAWYDVPNVANFYALPRMFLSVVTQRKKQIDKRKEKKTEKKKKKKKKEKKEST